MTDNEIIKALEYCEDSAYTDKHCLKCPYCNESYCLDKMMADALNLINRQKAEIDELTDTLDATIDGQKTLMQYIKTIRADAIKEFAERVKNKLTATTKTIAGDYVFEISGDFIDNLAKEMVGDGGG